MECVNMMLSGAWIPGESLSLLARRHNVSIVTVRHWASEAARLARFTMKDREDWREQAIAALATIQERATQLGEFDAATKAVDTTAKLLGFAQKHEVVLETTKAISPAEEWDELEKLEADIARRKREIAGRVRPTLGVPGGDDPAAGASADPAGVAGAGAQGPGAEHHQGPVVPDHRNQGRRRKRT